MQQGSRPASQDLVTLDERHPDSPIRGQEAESAIQSSPYPSIWTIDPPLYRSRPQDGRLETFLSLNHFNEDETHRDRSIVTMADFVESIFIPRYVMLKKAAGRAHFQGILKHILHPERIARAFRPGDHTRTRLAAIPGWPYLDEVPVSEIRPKHIQQLIQTSMGRGYSSQTVAHLRNVIRIVLSYAETFGYFTGPNPAALVMVPAITHKPARSLTLTQLKQVFQLMHYPEEQIALFALLTDMNVAEICGLKWKDVNSSNFIHYGSAEPLEARTIAVKMQIYRGEYRAVVGKRNRHVQIPELLQTALLHLKHRPEYNSGEDFVLASSCGTAVNPDNIAARRLKAIARVLDLSWLSWKVFHRTGIELQNRFGRYVSRELGHALTLKR